MNEFTTPTSRRAGSSKLSTPGTGASGRQFEHPAHRRLQSEAASSRFSSPSPSSERSARCRSTSLAPSSVRKKEELDRRWKEIGARCLSKWEMLEQKYAHITADDDDIVDITTLKIIVDRGVMRNARDSVFGENLSDEERSEATGLDSNDDEIGRWDDVSHSGDEEENGAVEESGDEGEASMDEDDRWDLAEFLRKNAMMPNPEEEDYGEEEEEHGYLEVEIPGAEEDGSQEDEAERSETPDEEELQRRRNHRSGSMRWDSSEALFSDGVDMDNEDELAAADSDLEEATRKLPAPARFDLVSSSCSPSSALMQQSPEPDAEPPRSTTKSATRWIGEERERVSASAGPSRPRTPSAQTSRLTSQPASRTSTTSVKKNAQRRLKLSGNRVVSEEEDSDGHLFTRPSAVPATEPKKRGRPKGSKNRPKVSLEAPASEPLPRTKKALPKSRSLPSLGLDTPTEAIRRSRAHLEIRDSDARSEPYAGAMSLVTLDDLFSPPPEERRTDIAIARNDSPLAASSRVPKTTPRGRTTATPHQSTSSVKPSKRTPHDTQLRHQSSTSSLDKANHRPSGERHAAGLDPAYYYAAPHPTRGTGMKHCKACRVAGGVREKLSELCRGRMGVAKCKFEEDKEHDDTFGNPQLDISNQRDSIPPTSEDEVTHRAAPPIRRLPEGVRRIRMDVGTEADDEASPSVHQRKLLKKRSEPPKTSRFSAIKQSAAQLVSRARQVFSTNSEDDMVIDPVLLDMEAPNDPRSRSPPPRTERVDPDEEEHETPAPKRSRQPSVFREPAPAQGGARDYTRPRVVHQTAPEPPIRDGYAPNLYFRSSGSFRLCALCRRAGGEREKYAMYCPGRTQSSKLCSFEGSAPPKARAATPAPRSELRAATPGKRRYIPRATPAPIPGPSTEEDSSSGGRGQRKRKRVNYEERPYDSADLYVDVEPDGSFTSADKENLPPHRSVHSLSQSHLPTPSPSVSAPKGSTSISPSSAHRSLTSPVDVLRPRRVSSLAAARPTPPPAFAARGSSEALGWSWNRGSTPQRGILRRPSESSASEQPRSAKRIRFSQAPRSPSNGYSPAAAGYEASPREASEDELLLHDNSSPPADDEGPLLRQNTGDSPRISREWRIRAMDAGISVPHHTGRLPSTLLKNIGPVAPNSSSVPGISLPRPLQERAPSPGTGSILRHTNPHIAALMLPPPLPSKATPSRIGLSPLSRELHLDKTPVRRSTQGTAARRAVSSVPTQRTMETHVVKRHWSSAPRKTAAEKDPDWVPGESD